MSARSFTLDKKKQGNIVVHKYDDGHTIVNLHGHTVAYKTAQGDVFISSCGYHTNTTKTAINRFFSLLNMPYGVSQVKGNWYLVDRETNTKIDFFDGMVVNKSKLEKVLA